MMKKYFESKCSKLEDKNKNILTVQFYLVLFKNYLRIYNIPRDIYLRLLRYYLKTMLILLQILINYKKFPFMSKKEFKIGNIKMKSFGILRNVVRVEMEEEHI